VNPIRIPPQLADAVAVADHDYPARLEWLAALPDVVAEIASEWQLELGDPYIPGGHCAWVAPARTPAADELVLKLGWRHREAEHEADSRGLDPGLAQRMADLLDLDPELVRLWLFARCAQESLHDLTTREVARRLAP
jgi:hypothetical protein